MALDPRISLAVQTPNVGDIFSNILTNVSSLDTLKENRELAPFRKQQAIDLQAQRQAQTEGTRLQNLSTRDKRRLADVSRFGSQVLPFLQNNDVQGARNVALQRLESLARRQEAGEEVDTTETRQFLQALDSNPQIALQMAQQASQLGRGQQTSVKQREFESLLRVAQDPNATEFERNSAKRELGGLARVGSSTTERIATDPNLSSLVAQSQADIAEAKAQVISDVKVSEAKAIETETEAGRQKIIKGGLNIDETKIKNTEKKRELIEAKNLRRKEANNAITVVDSLLKDDVFSNAFGRFNNAPPEGFRTQANIDARAQVDQIVGLITLESRNKLKGQGTISDSESKTLEKSSTILTNPLIGDNVARKELRRVQRIFEDASDRNQLKQQTKEEAAKPKTFNSPVLGRDVSEQDLLDTLSANPGLTRDQLFKQLGI